ncbi:putative transposable element, partial [Pseudoloma neurophilia]
LVIDHYLKYIETCILEKKDQQTVWNALKKVWIDKHGISVMFYSDMGREFDNEYVSKQVKDLDSEWHYNSPDNHQAVGCVERANQTFFRKLEKKNFLILALLIGNNMLKRLQQQPIFLLIEL